jgi:uncharacterized membrane protein YgcG
MTRSISPLAITAPVAALAVVAATGWAVSATNENAAAVDPPAATVAAAAQKDPALRAITKAIAAERADVRHLERAVAHARKSLQKAREQSAIVSASVSSTATGGYSSSSSTSSGGSTGSSSAGSSGNGGSSSGGGAAPAAPKPAPAANTTTAGS